MSAASRDLVHASRGLRRAPWFSLTAIGLLATTMALAVTVFAIVDGPLFQPLRYPQPGQLWVIKPGFSEPVPERLFPGVSAADATAWAAAIPGSAVTAFRASNLTVVGTGVNEPYVGLAFVQANFFDVIGVHPAAGGFTAADFTESRPLTPVIISDALWRRRFNGADDIIGREIIQDPTGPWGFRIVGVMPRGFVFPADRVPVDVIEPRVLAPASQTDPSVRGFTVALARVPDKASAETLRTQVEAGMARVARIFPPVGPKPPYASVAFWRSQGPFDRAEVEPLRTKLGRQNRPLFLSVFAAAAVLLLLAALNVSGLMAARALDRAREFSLRRALGASRDRLVRIILADAVVLVGVSGALALVLAGPFVHFVLGLLPDDLVLFKTPAVDARAMAFVTLTSIVITMLTSAWPVRRALGAAPSPSPDAGRTTDRARSLGRFVVVSAQVAGALVLTTGGALLIGSILRVYAIPRPVRTTGVTAIETQLLNMGSMNTVFPQRAAHVNALIDRLRRLPGVVDVAANGAELLRGGDWPMALSPPAGAPTPRLDGHIQAVTPHFYRLVNLPIVAGRLPTNAELAADAPVVVVSESLARAWWRGGQALGQTLVAARQNRPEANDPTVYTVIGIARDVPWTSWDEESPEIYGPYARLARYPFATFFLHITGDETEVTARALAVIRDTDSLVKVRYSHTLDALYLDSVRPRRFKAWLFGSFAAAALGVIGVGVLGLLAAATSRRTREMGIRFALGATPGSVVGLILREQMTAVLAGLAAGGLIAAWTVRLLKSYLYQLTVYDARVWGTAVGLVLAVAALGAMLPALRASRIDPAQTLRAE